MPTTAQKNIIKQAAIGDEKDLINLAAGDSSVNEDESKTTAAPVSEVQQPTFTRHNPKSDPEYIRMLNAKTVDLQNKWNVLSEKDAANIASLYAKRQNNPTLAIQVAITDAFRLHKFKVEPKLKDDGSKTVARINSSIVDHANV